MKKTFKAVIVFLLVLLALGIFVSLPIVPTAIQVTNCSNQTSCSTVVLYESISQELCIFSNCGSVATLTLAYGVLSSGTRSTPTQRGSATLMVGILNPGSQTTITEINVTSSPTNVLNDSNSMTVYQCQSTSTCQRSSTVTILTNSFSNFNTTESAFYLGSNITEGSDYYFAISFSNGQSVAGQLTAR